MTPNPSSSNTSKTPAASSNGGGGGADCCGGSSAENGTQSTVSSDFSPDHAPEGNLIPVSGDGSGGDDFTGGRIGSIDQLCQQLHRLQIVARHGLEPEAPRVNLQEYHLWSEGLAAGVRYHGCWLVWIGASAKVLAENESRRIGAGATGGGERESKVESCPDRVPWKFLSDHLGHNLYWTLTIPSKHNQVVDAGSYEEPVRITDSRREEDAGSQGEDGFSGGGGGSGADRDGGFGGGFGYGDINDQPPRVMNGEELRFVRGVLRLKQRQTADENIGGSCAGHARLKRPKHGSGVVDSSGVVVSPEGQGRNGSDSRKFNGHDDNEAGDDVDFISLKAFVLFSEWWGPSMTTLSRLREDWASTTPVKVHGFVGRLEAERKLLSRDRGTFLLRFSESEPGALVISFTENVRASCLVSKVAPVFVFKTAVFFGKLINHPRDKSN